MVTKQNKTGGKKRIAPGKTDLIHYFSFFYPVVLDKAVFLLNPGEKC
jgi:hypothetical protein